MLFSLPHGLITSILWATTPPSPQPSLTFHLRHQHAVTNTSRIIFSDVPFSLLMGGGLSIPTTESQIPRPQDLAAFHHARRNPTHGFTPALDWDLPTIPTPDLSKRSTLLNLASMTFNAYAPDNTTSEWYDLPSSSWPGRHPFGWGPEEDGMRGHIFVSEDNSTVVISTKGTSAGWLAGGGGPTVGKDKKNDNLLFSCCCARVGPTWSTVCGCYEGGYKCDSRCVEEALGEEGLFYNEGLNLYNNVTYMYPNANIWLTGHSLGGGLSSLLGATFGVPVVAFEAPAERLASQRLHLPSPPSTHHITHVYHTADPIPMGTCTGVTSLCSIGGFALETRCHLGQVILYDTVQQLGWSVDVRNHPIKVVIENLLVEGSGYRVGGKIESQNDGESQRGWGMRMMRWGWGRKGGEEDPGDDEGGDKDGETREVPEPRLASEVEGVDGICTDCFDWEFGDFRNRT